MATQNSELFAPGDQGPGIIAANIIVATAATIGVGLRVWARRIQKIPLKADDFTILASLPFGWAACVVFTIAAKHGLGRHIGTIPPSDLIILGQALLAGELIWAVTIPIIKLSILLLYTRIFGRLRYFRILAWTLGAFSILWSISVFVTLCLQCRPIQFNWDKEIDGTCIDTQKFYIAGSAPNTFTDLLILLLPLPAVWGLQTTKSQKAVLTGIFFLGSLTCAISLARLINLTQNYGEDVSWGLGITGAWSTAELCLGIFSACLPTLRPLLKAAKIAVASTFLSTTRATPSKPESQHSSKYFTYSNTLGRDGFRQLDNNHEPTVSSTAVSRGTCHEMGDIPVDSIKVERGTTWNEESV